MNTSTKSPPMTEAEAARWTEREEAELERYQAELKRAERSGNRGNIEIARGKIAKIERGRQSRVDSVWRRTANSETVDLALARDETVDLEPVAGAAYMLSRDALAHMLKLGHITPAQHKAGLIYRIAFEARGADLQASQISDSGGRGHDNDLFVFRKMEQAKAAEFAKACEVAVRKACMVEHLSGPQMLQWVAGMGRPLRHFGGGRAFERNRLALAAALDVVSRLWADKVSRNAGETSQSA